MFTRRQDLQNDDERESGVFLSRPELAEAVVAFGQPLLATLNPSMDIQRIEGALEVVITMWNALVEAGAPHGDRRRLELLERAARAGVAPGLEELFDALTARYDHSFADDRRMVGAWHVARSSAQDYHLFCSEATSFAATA